MKPLCLSIVIILLGSTYISAQQITDGPSPRAHHSLAFDSTRGEVILYGGSTAAPNDTSIIFDDLWSWTGQRWNRIATTGLPSSSHRLVFDSARKRLLLIGGMNEQRQYSETRAFDGKNWVSLTNNSELPTIEPAATYDTRRQRVVFFGGMRADRTLSGETWEFDGDNWKTHGHDRSSSASFSRDGL